MGTGIAIVAASQGKLNSQIVCENEKAVASCRSFVEGWAEKELKKNRLDEQSKKELLGRVSYVTDLSKAAGADFVVEAVYENFELKK